MSISVSNAVASPTVTPAAWDAYNKVVKGKLLAAVYELSTDESRIDVRGQVELGDNMWVSQHCVCGV